MTSATRRRVIRLAYLISLFPVVARSSRVTMN